MKSYFRIVTILLLMMHISFGYAEETKKVYSYDWKRHEELIDKQFEEFAQQVLQIERQKVESLLTKDRANKYMEYFEKGMRSEGGLIMMEGEESRWLEIAYYSGYQQKVLFRQGYFAGLVKAAEFSEVFIAQPLQLTIKSDKQVYKAREKITVEIKLTNVGDKEFYLNTWIFDHPQAIEAIIKGPEGVVDKTIFIDYDYKMNEKDDFMLLPRRGSYVNKLHSESSPYHFLGHELKKPGIYTIAVVYENEGDSYWSQDEQKMIAVTNAWLGKVTSNTITIEVKEKVK